MALNPLEMKSMLIAPENLSFTTPANAVLGSHLGNSSNALREIPPNSGETALNGGQVLWNTAFPDGLVDSTPRLRCEMTIQVNNVAGADSNAVLTALTQKIGVASFPLNRAIRSGTVDINGTQFTTPVAQNVDPFVYSSDPLNLALISEASERDEYDQFDEAILSDPLHSGANAPDAVRSRGLGCNYRIVSFSADSAAHTASIKIILEEALMMEPFQFAEMANPSPFKNINRFVLTLNLASDLAGEMVNLNPTIPADGAGGVTASIANASWSLLTRSYNPSAVQSIPPVLVYNSPQINTLASQQVTTGAPAARGAELVTSSFTFPATILNGVPSMFAFFVERPRDTYGAKRFLPIISASINMDNKTSLLSTLTTTELYQVSVNNGFNMRFATFIGDSASPTTNGGVGDINGAGGILFVRPSDLGLNEGTIANANKTIQLTATLTCRNVVNAENCVARIVTIQDNFVQDSAGTWTSIRPLVPEQKLLSSPISYSQKMRVSNHVMGGAGWTDWLSSAWNRFKDYVTSESFKKKSSKVRNLPGVRDYVGNKTLPGQIARTFGYGNTRHHSQGGDIVKLGGDLIQTRGGKKLTKAQLKKMLEM